MPSSRLHHLPASALLPRWRSLICLYRYQNQLQIPWGCPKLCSAAWGCFLPSSQASPHRKRLWGMWGREHWEPGSTCSSTPPVAVNALTCSVFEIAICPCPKGAANCTNVFKINSRKIHIMQTSSLFPDDTTWRTKHKQKWTKESTEALWKKTHLVKGFSALFTAIGTVIMLNWLVGHKNWINWDTEETNESKETNSKNKWAKRWKTEMQSLNCSCNCSGNSHI